MAENASKPVVMPNDPDGRMPWAQVVRAKTEQRDRAIDAYRNISASNVDAITSIDDISELATVIASGKYTAYDVVLAYIQKAIAAHDKTNCLTEIIFHNALARARAMDEQLHRNGTIQGPLHGVPMTVKDQFNVEGYDSTLGYCGRAYQPATEDAILVDILRNAGAIIIAKTNLPQSIMWCETENPLWGLTTHPQGRHLTPGGSSGGESALMALHGSPFGWGTDLGGSVRMPAHLTGVYGFKPSSARLPYEGVPVSTEGQEHVPSAVGCFARSVSSIALVMREVLKAKPWDRDPRVDPRPWDELSYASVQSKPLTIGLLLDDGVVKVHPSVERVLRSVATKLERAGHDVFHWPADGHAECIRVLDQFFTADGGEDIKRDVAASGEPFLPHVQALVTRAPAISVYEYWQLNRAKRAAQKTYLDKWRATRHPRSGAEADVLLTPVMPHPAVPHRMCRWVGYTKVWNVLDYPAMTIPAGAVDKGVDVPRSDAAVSSYVPRNDLDRWNWDLYDPEVSHGLPVAVQVIAPRLQDERVVGVAKVIESLLGQ